MVDIASGGFQFVLFFALVWVALFGLVGFAIKQRIEVVLLFNGIGIASMMLLFPFLAAGFS